MPEIKEQLKYKVKDMSLAEWGRKEIELAEAEMPGLMALRAQYKGKNPLKGARMPMTGPGTGRFSPRAIISPVS